MKIIRARERHVRGNGPFQIKILFPGESSGNLDTGLGTIGRFDHAVLKPGAFVKMHPHVDDEIFSYLRAGKMVHQDTTGKEVEINPQYLMMMNAGSGFQHEERVAEDAEPIEMLQIFIRPEYSGMPPEVNFYEFNETYGHNQWRLLAGNDPEAPLRLRSQTNIYDARLEKKKTLSIPTKPEITQLLYCFEGEISFGIEFLEKGDAIILKNESLEVLAEETTDMVLFETMEQSRYYERGMYSGNKFFG